MKTRTAEEIWAAALGELQLQVNRANFDTWLRDTRGLSYEGSSFTVGTPTNFATEWLERRMHSLIKKTLMGIMGQPIDISFELMKNPGSREVAGPEPAPSPVTANYAGNGYNNRIPYAKLNARYTFASFIVGNCNRLAHAAALGVAGNPTQAYNPLFFYAGTGLGKTHLLHAVGHVVTGRPGARVMYVTGEQFTNDFVNALKTNTTEDFRQKYNSLDLLLMDDIQFIAGKEQTQEVLFHTFNDLHNAGKYIVMSSDRHPKSMPLLEDRLQSRFQWGLIADIQPPDLETRLAILRAKAEEQKAEVPQEVIDFIARRIQKNIRELEGSLNRVVAYAKLARVPLTVDMASQFLSDMTASVNRRSLSADQVKGAVSLYFQVDLPLLTGTRRDKHIALARQVSMYLLREELQKSWAEIGRELGGRDHTTILHGYNKIATGINISAELRRQVLEIRDTLYSQKT
ncbi:MAG: chromosomal replication initiator protein DnaA [Dehalococcoidia bacterium]|nr:chromosomal replication initiator protein DnaA [Dehalococcoidia bacterium]